MKPGDQFGPYTIVSPLGEGGMGEVWKAHDPRLNRTVALKIAKADFTQRFEREARAIATLSHPNICVVHDVGPNFMVMELVDGQPLKGPQPLPKALVYASQILDALAAAHAEGITHRDLKPANILVTKQGIKLVDFGLAKHSSPLRDSDTTATITAEGQIVGTLQYMAPEQLQGREADSRSDLFSFGCVFYELLTGKRAFVGDSPASVIAAVLEREPAHLSETAPLERVVRRCLAKDPDERWQTARDLKAALQWAAAPDMAVKPKRTFVSWLGWTAAVVAAGGLAWNLRSSPPPASLTRFLVTPPEAFTPPANTSVPVPQFAISPDGTSLVFVTSAVGGTAHLWLRTITDTTPRMLEGTDDASLPFWSTDSRWIGFFANKQMKKVSLAGGTPQRITEGIADVFGGAWAPDDTIIFGSGAAGLQRVSASGGSVTQITKFDASHGDGAHRWPQFLPDGRNFLFFVRARIEHKGVYASSLDGAPPKLVLRSDTNAIYASGHLLYVEDDTIFAQPFDTRRLQLTGSRFALADTQVGRASTSLSGISASTNGILAHAGRILRPGQLTWMDRGGATSASIGPEADVLDFRLSPNEQFVALSAVDSKTTYPDVWLADLSRGNVSRLTFGPALNASPLWSPDASELIFRTNRLGTAVELFRRPVRGDGQLTSVLSLEKARAAGIRSIAHLPSDWSPDGQHVLLTAPSPDSGFDVWLLPLKSGQPILLIGGAGDQAHANFSPDGHSVAYVSSESGRPEVYVQSFPGASGKVQISTAGGTEPRWRKDGREVYYLALDGTLMAVTVGSTFAIPKALFPTNLAGQTTFYRTHYVPAADGQRFLMNRPVPPKSPAAITVTLNWLAAQR